jgi:hypothetical protein
VRKSVRPKKESSKYKDYEAAGVGKGKQREGQKSGQQAVRGMKKRAGKQ